MTVVEQAPPLTRALQQSYRHGFTTDVESDSLSPGLDAETVRAISRRKREPDFLLQWRLAAFERWQPPTRCSAGMRTCVPPSFTAPTAVPSRWSEATWQRRGRKSTSRVHQIRKLIERWPRTERARSTWHGRR